MNESLAVFNNYFKNNYYGLVAYSIQIGQSINRLETKEHWAQDILHDSYEKIHKRLSTKPFEGNITGYTLITINNSLITHYKQRVKIIPINFNEDSISNIEDILIKTEEDHANTIVERNNLELLSKNIFKFLSLNYNQKEQYIFRTYYLNNKMTYNKVEQITRINITEISRVIKRIKIDLKNNFNNWMLTNGIK